MYKYTPMFESFRVIKKFIQFVSDNPGIENTITPYFEVGHKDIDSEKKYIKQIVDLNFPSYFLDYRYFRREPESILEKEWVVCNDVNIFDYIDEKLKTTDEEKRSGIGIYKNLIPVISILKNNGSLNGSLEHYSRLYELGRRQGYERIGVRIPISARINLEKSELWPFLKTLNESDFLLLDLRSTISDFDFDSYLEILTKLISKIKLQNGKPKIILLNPITWIDLGNGVKNKRNVGHELISKTGVHGYGDYMSESESHPRKRYNKAARLNSSKIYYYDYLKGVTIPFPYEGRELETLKEIRNNSYLMDLEISHSPYCKYSREFLELLDGLPGTIDKFNKRRVAIKEGHYLVSIYLDAIGTTEEIRNEMERNGHKA